MKKNPQSSKPEVRESKLLAPKPSDAKPAPTSPAPRTARESATKTGGARKPRAGGLTAAAQVLAKSKQPMSCTALTERIIDLKLWKTSGKTPAATINAAMLREIKAKGASARFRKVGRGLFAAGKSAR